LVLLLCGTITFGKTIVLGITISTLLCQLKGIPPWLIWQYVVYVKNNIVMVSIAFLICLILFLKYKKPFKLT